MTEEFYLTYERVSTDDQALTKSCDDQKSVNDRHIEAQEWQLAPNGDYRDEGISGSTLDRPGLQDLLIRCQEDKTIKGVVVTETDRLARGNDAYIPIRAILKKIGIRVVAVTQPMIDGTEEGEMFGEIMGAINGFFSKITRRKSMRALDEKALRGWYPSKAPLGYINVNIGTEEKPDRIIQVDESVKPYVQQIPVLYNKGHSYEDISSILYEQGLKGKEQGKVSPEEVRKILFSDFYLGEFSWRQKKYKGNHPALFDWFEVQKARNRSQEKGHTHSTKELRDKFLFKKLPFQCIDCNCHITAEHKIKRYKKRTAEHILYHCTKSKGGWTVCTQPSINREDLIMEFVIKGVAPINIDQELAEFMFEEMCNDYANNKQKQDELLESMNRRLGQIDAELRNLLEMRMHGSIVPLENKTPDQIYQEYCFKKEHERKTILKAKKNLLEDQGDWKQRASNFFSLCIDATNEFLNANEEKQYLFLRKITSNVFLDNKQLVFTHQFPFSALAKRSANPSMLRD